MKRNLLTRFCFFSFALISIFIFTQCGSKDKNAELIETLETLVKTINIQCPITVDPTMRLDSCVAKDTELAYYYTMTEDDIFDKEIFEEIGVPSIKENLKNNPDMDYFRKYNVSIRYIYSDNTGKKLYEFTLTTNDIN